MGKVKKKGGETFWGSPASLSHASNGKDTGENLERKRQRKEKTSLNNLRGNEGKEEKSLKKKKL